jgi:hypothetical protein
MTTWATQRLDALVGGESGLPPVVETLRLGTLDSWQPLFGGYVAALADGELIAEASAQQLVQPVGAAQALSRRAPPGRRSRRA